MAPLHGFAPNLDALLRTKRPLDATVDTAVNLLKRRQIHGPDAAARATAHVLAQVVAHARWADVDQLVARVVVVGRQLAAAQPHERVIGHIVRRVLGVIRGEAETDAQEIGAIGVTASTTTPFTSFTTTEDPPTPTLSSSASFPALPRASTASMFQLLSGVGMGSVGSPSATASGASSPTVDVGGSFASTASISAAAAGSARLAALRDEILGAIDEIADEIGQADDQIAGFAEAQIRPGDGVLVGELTRTIEKFLVKAAARRRYTLFLAGVQASATLSKRLAGRVDVVQISSPAAALPRVHRLLLDARAIAADGGVLAGAGSARLARAAHARGKTVLVVGGVYRLAPSAWTDPQAYVEWAAPEPFSDGALVDMDVERARTEYVPAGLVDVYVTNLGPHAREYLEGVAADHYRAEDAEVFA